jgi:hypothetical protein
MGRRHQTRDETARRHRAGDRPPQGRPSNGPQPSQRPRRRPPQRCPRRRRLQLPPPPAVADSDLARSAPGGPPIRPEPSASLNVLARGNFTDDSFTPPGSLPCAGLRSPGRWTRCQSHRVAKTWPDNDTSLLRGCRAGVARNCLDAVFFGAWRRAIVSGPPHGPDAALRGVSGLGRCGKPRTNPQIAAKRNACFQPVATVERRRNRRSPAERSARRRSRAAGNCFQCVSQVA